MGQNSLAGLEPVVVLTGAGISSESGVPTFRGAEGMWENHRPEDLATPSAFHKDPEKVWRFYAWRRQVIGACAPNAAHRLLAEMESEIDDFTLITQNIDGLHQAAGSQRVIELHGSLWRERCLREGKRWESREQESPSPLRLCPDCGSLARPDVVWFGEGLDHQVYRRALEAAGRARTMLVIGTSAVVEPAASLPLLAQRAGAKLIEINPEVTPLSAWVNERLAGPATRELASWWTGQLAGT